MAKYSPEYYRKKVQEHRSLEKILGERYRSQEAIPGETFTNFKRRVKISKLLSIISLGLVFFFQLTPAII